MSISPKSFSYALPSSPFPQNQNRPLNNQAVADSLQKFNLKKTAIQKALDSLADNGKISSKEYGEQKIYLVRQDQFDIPNNEELNQMKEENTKLLEQLNEQKKAILEVKLMEEKLIKLMQGVTLVSPGQRQIVEKTYVDMMNHWGRRKRMFKDIWDAITENSPKNLKEFKEELEIGYDEDVGVNLQSCADLIQSGKKRA